MPGYDSSAGGRHHSWCRFAVPYGALNLLAHTAVTGFVRRRLPFHARCCVADEPFQRVPADFDADFYLVGCWTNQYVYLALDANDALLLWLWCRRIRGNTWRPVLTCWLKPACQQAASVTPRHRGVAMPTTTTGRRQAASNTPGAVTYAPISTKQGHTPLPYDGAYNAHHRSERSTGLLVTTDGRWFRFFAFAFTVEFAEREHEHFFIFAMIRAARRYCFTTYCYHICLRSLFISGPPHCLGYLTVLCPLFSL